MSLYEITLLSLFVYAGYVGWRNANSTMEKTKDGRLPSCNTKDDNTYFFFIDYN